MTSSVRKYAALALATILLAACGGKVERQQRYMQRGDAFLEEQNYDKARVEYSNALQIDPKNSLARFHLGQIAERQGNPRDALGHYQAALDSNPDDTQSRAAMARVLLLGGLPDKASEILGPGLQKTPNDPRLLTVRGAIKAQNGSLEEAIADAEAAHKSDPGDEYAVALLASTYNRVGRADDAIRVVTDSIGRLPRNVDLRVILAELQMRKGNADTARKLLEEVLSIEPKEMTHRQRLAQFHLMNKDPATAEKVMRDAVSDDPGNAEAKFALVQLIGSQRGPAGAEEQMLKFIAAEPKNAELRLALGRFYEAQKKSAEARQAYQQIVADEGVKPNGLVARNRLAALSLQDNDRDAAEKLVGEVLKESPRDNEALVMRANLALARGDAPAAITDLRAVLRDQPGAVPVLRALARAHLRNNEPSLAEESLRNAMQARPKDVAVRLDLVAFLAQSGQLDQARALVDQVVTDVPGEIAAFEAQFRVMLAQGDEANAERAVESVRRLRPELPVAAMLSGQLHERQRKLDAAAADYEAALKLQPDSADAINALVRLDLQQKQPARALSRLAAAIEKWPGNALLRQLQGEVQMFSGQWDAAVASFDAAAERAPGWPMPYRGKALARISQKQPQDAISTLQSGVSKTGSAQLVVQLGDLLARQQRIPEGIKLYEDALARNPKSLPLANNLAMLLINNRADRPSLDRAAQLAESLGSSSEATYLDTRGWVKFKRAEYPAAVSLLQQAVDKAPGSLELRYHLGMALLKNGDPVRAREHLEAALKPGVDFAGAGDARTALKGLTGRG